MLIIANFIGDDTFMHIVETNNLTPELKTDVENALKTNSMPVLDGSNYFSGVQKAAVFDQVFPLTIHGIVDIYLS